MAKNSMYGICFIPEKINNNIIMLRASHIVDGNICDNLLYDKYDESYSPITFSVESEDYDKTYGLGVLEDELLDYAIANGFPNSIKSSSNMCAKIYLECIKKYVFFLELNDGKTVCSAMSLHSKKIYDIELDKSAINQLPESFTYNNTKYYPKVDRRLTNPYVLYDKIRKRVVGQDEAAFALSATVCKNIKYGHLEGMKSNVLLYGPSGCGKTELVRTLAKELNIPLIIEDMTSYTASGFVGDSVKKILRRLVNSCNGNVKKAESGIIVLDEIDKLASNDSRESVNKTDVQEELLKIIEGGEFDLNDGNRTSDELIINTSNITFVLCGAFSKFLESSKKNVVGFNSQIQEDKQVKVMTNEDLVKYGLMPELVGRINKLIPIKALKTKELEEIIAKSDISCLKIYETALLQEDKVHVVYNDKNKFIHCVASKAEKLGSGARALKTIIDDVFICASAEISKEYPVSRELVVSSETIDNPRVYLLKRLKRGNKYELSERNGKNHT